MVKRSGLGKGLDSLISNQYTKKVDNPEKTQKNSTELSTNVNENVDKKVDNPENEPKTMLKVSLIEPNREQPRKNFDEEALEELAESIRQYGVLQPILVTPNGKRYTIVAGERRWRAAKLAKVKEVPVVIREFSKQEVMEIALIENIQREDLNPIEEAKAYMKLLQEFNMKQEELASKISKSRTAIANRMRLLKLPEEVQEMLINGCISEGHARALLGLEDPKQQVYAANQILALSLTVRDTEKLVKNLLNTPAKPIDDDWKEKGRLAYEKLESDLRDLMGTKVVIQRKNEDKGKIQIEYYSIEELERIMDLFRKIK